VEGEGVITLSALAFDVAWRETVGDRHHVALRCDSPGRTWAERARYVAMARRELDVDLSLLGLFARPDTELYGWYRDGTATHAALAVAKGGRVAVAHRHGEHVTLRRATDLATAVLDGLPPAHPLTVSTTVPLPAEHDEYADPLHRTTLPALLTAPRHGAGEFHAARRDRLGRRTRAEFPVAYADTGEGRFVTTLRRAQEGVVWLNILPARLLHQELDTLVTIF
jgi:hypothetical protein